MKLSAYQVLFSLAISAIVFASCGREKAASVSAAKAGLILAFIEKVDVRPSDGSINLVLTGIKRGCDGAVDHFAETREGDRISISAFLKRDAEAGGCPQDARNFELPYLITDLKPGKYFLVVRSSGDDLQQEFTVDAIKSARTG